MQWLKVREPAALSIAVGNNGEKCADGQPSKQMCDKNSICWILIEESMAAGRESDSLQSHIAESEECFDSKVIAAYHRMRNGK